MNRILPILAFFFCFDLSAQIELKGLAFGLGGSALYQQSKFNHTDFTGITDWKYDARVQWAADVRAKYYSGNRWQFGFSLGVKEAGWNKVNDHPELEPHWERIKYSFLYSFADLSLGRTVFLVSRFFWNVGVIQHANVNSQYKMQYTDGSTENLENELVIPERFPTSGYAGIECRLLWTQPLIITTEYKFQFGLTKFHEAIMRGTQLHHSLGLNFYFGRK